MIRLQAAFLVVFAMVFFGSGSGIATAQQAASGASASKKCSVDKTPVSPADAALYATDYSQAAKLYKQLADQDPASVEAQAGLIRVLLGQNKLNDALEAANHLATAQPKSAVAQTVLGETYLRRGEVDLAQPVLVKAVALDSCYGRAYYAESRMEHLSLMRATEARLLAAAHSLSPLDDDIQEAWMWSLPAAERFPALTAYAENNPYLDKSDREDLKSRIKERQFRVESKCTVTSPKGGTSLVLHPGPMHGPDPGIVTIDMSFNDKKKRLEFGTSGYTIEISRSMADHLGLKPEVRVSYDQLFGGGRLAYYMIRVPILRFGDIEFKNCPVEVLDVPFTERNMEDADGYIGAGFFADFVVNINFPANTINLTTLPKLAVNEANGLQMWSIAGQENNVEVPSHSGGDWAPYDRTVAPEMSDWARAYRNEGDLLIPTRIGPGHERLFYLNLNSLHPRISSTVVNEATTLDKMMEDTHSAKAKNTLKALGSDHYFMSFGGLILPVDSWTSSDFSRFSIATNLDVAGVVSQNALKQLDVTIDYRDGLVKFKRPKPTAQ